MYKPWDMLMTDAEVVQAYIKHPDTYSYPCRKNAKHKRRVEVHDGGVVIQCKRWWCRYTEPISVTTVDLMHHVLRTKLTVYKCSVVHPRES